VDFLEILRAFAERDRAAPGMTGKLAIGVRGPSGVRWLHVTLRQNAHATFSDSVDTDVDAALLMGEPEAATLLSGKTLSEPTCLQRYGNASLITQFMNRYVRRQSLLAFRVGGV
jgi:hypothetical protein